MICRKCGAALPENGGFCPNCGTRYADATFDSAIYKQRAKERLRGHYWPAFAVSLIAAILAGGPDVVIRLNRNIAQNGSYASHSVSVMMSVLAVTYALLLLSLIYNFFVGYPIQVGSAKYFVRLHDGEDNIADVFYSFKGVHYLKIVGAMAWQYLFIFLWSLLLIIPGIVKAYAYCLVPYILAENPHIGYRRAIKLSMQMTNGFKGEIFVLQLSFIGWFLLGAICLGVGILFVQPYYNATFAEMYVSLKNNALYLGICREEDFR